MPPAGLRCTKCNLSFGFDGSSESEACVSFGDRFFHTSCRCAKCQNLVEHEANLLLLSDGSPVCENCSYNCSLCRQPITNEAILTGDESYCPSCFRCRSCENKIEELVFAKTSQGIYCMTCHNERVSRSRRHAEAKRNKAKGSKTAASAKPGASRHNTTSPQPSAQSDVFFPVASSSNPSPNKPLPPPQITTPQRMDSITRSERSQAEPESPTNNRFDKSRSPTPPVRPLQLGSSRPKSPQSLHRPATAGPESSKSGDEEATPARPFESSPQLSDKESASAPASHTGFPNNVQTNSTTPKRHSLMAPSKADKASNRRSGFYGNPSVPPVPARPTQYGSPLKEADETEVVAHSPVEIRMGHDFPQEAVLPTPPLSPALPSTPSTPSATQEQMGITTPPPPPRNVMQPPSKAIANLSVTTSPSMPRNLSFYDPDLLLDIPSTPDVPPMARRRGSSTDDLASRIPEDGPDGFPSPDLDEVHTARPVDADLDEMTDQLSPIKRLRDSLKPAAEGEALNLDVNLIDGLITELEDTRSKMKNLQREYNAMKRASTSFIEGINTVRDSYERESVLRQRAEDEMAALKTRLYEQAKKLVDLNAAQREERDFEKRSSELRSSVYGMEQQLSTLQIERDMTVAEIEQLSSVHDLSTSAMSTPDKAAASLKSRLDGLKDEHRQDLLQLAAQRDDLAREVADLTRQRDHLTEENVVLEARSMELTAQHREAVKQLEGAREATALQRQPYNISLRGHQKTSTSLGSSASSNGSYDTTSDAGLMQGHRIEQAQPARKFKWGKGKPIDAKASSGHTHKGSQNSVTLNGRTAPSTDIAIRQHLFQPVSILRPVRCEHCGDKMWGLQELRCAACGLYCHSRCAPFYHMQCNSAASFVPEDGSSTPSELFGNDLSRQVELENRQVPNIVSACIAAVEEYGMDFEGIYRKTGGMSQVKQITQAFEVSDTFSPADGSYDMAAVTSVLKNYFRALADPLFTFQLHDEFVSVAETQGSDAQKVEALERVMAKLPDAHYATLGLLMTHLHNVHLRSDENKMTPANLGVVFSPTLLRSGVAGQEFNDINHRARVVELCVEHAPALFQA